MQYATKSLQEQIISKSLLFTESRQGNNILQENYIDGLSEQKPRIIFEREVLECAFQ